MSLNWLLAVLFAVTIAACSSHKNDIRATSHFPQRTRIDFSAGGSGALIFGKLDPQEVYRVISAHFDQVTDCYERQFDLTCPASGSVVVDWKIAASGHAWDAQVIESSIKNSSVESCILRQILDWRFPPTKDGGIARVEHYPFHFYVR